MYGGGGTAKGKICTKRNNTALKTQALKSDRFKFQPGHLLTRPEQTFLVLRLFPEIRKAIVTVALETVTVHLNGEGRERSVTLPQVGNVSLVSV